MKRCNAMHAFDTSSNVIHDVRGKREASPVVTWRRDAQLEGKEKRIVSNHRTDA